MKSKTNRYFRTWTEEEQNLLILNHTKSPKELCSILNKNRNQIQSRLNWLRSKDIIPYVVKKRSAIYSLFDANTINFIKENYPRYGSTFCMIKTGLSIKDIRKICGSLGVRLNSGPVKMTKDNFYYFDENLLLTPSKEFAYLLGFIWGDGYCNGNSTILNNKHDDIDAIIPILFKIGRWVIRNHERSNNDGAERIPQKDAILNNTALATFLNQFGYDGKKSGSANPILQWLPDCLKRYWWRGFFDADGHLTFKQDGYFNVRRIHFSLSSSFEQNWDFALTLFEALNIKNHRIYQYNSDKNHSSSRAEITNRVDVVKVLNFIYSDYDYIGLSRKYIVYLELIDNIVNRKLRVKTSNQDTLDISEEDWNIVKHNYGNIVNAVSKDIGLL